MLYAEYFLRSFVMNMTWTWFTRLDDNRLPLMSLFWIWTIKQEFSSQNTLSSSELSRWCLKNTHSVSVSCWQVWREEYTDLLLETQQTCTAVIQPSSSNRRLFMSELTHAYFNCKSRERKSLKFDCFSPYFYEIVYNLGLGRKPLTT